MKYNIRTLKLFSVIVFIELFSVPLYGQLGVGISFGNTVPLHELSAAKITPSDINSYTLNISYAPKKIGLGLQFTTSTIKTNQDYLGQLERFEIQKNFTQDSWKNEFLFLGPIVKLGGKKISIDLFPKIGIGNITSPDRQFFHQNGQEQSIIYQDNSTETDLVGTQVFSGLDAKINIGITNSISTHVFAGINTNRFFGTGNSTIHREVLGNETTIEDFVSRRLLQVDCAYYELLSIGAGITISFPRKNKDSPTEDEEVHPPINQYPEDGSNLSLSKADSILFEWTPESKKLKGTNYILSLYKVRGGKDSLVFSKKIKKEDEFDHTNEPALQIGRYKWIVQAVDANGIKQCKEGCFSEEAEFEVGGLFLHQYYHLVSKDAGSFVPISKRLRFIVDLSLLFSKKLNVEIIDEEQLVVLAANDILRDNKKIKNVSSNRFDMDITQLRTGSYYLLRVYNDERSYFLRFHTKKIENE